MIVIKRNPMDEMGYPKAVGTLSGLMSVIIIRAESAAASDCANVKQDALGEIVSIAKKGIAKAEKHVWEANNDS